VFALLNRRLNALERQQQKKATNELAYTWDQLAISCSCPPDTTLHVREGWVQQGSFWVVQETIWFPALDIDFTDPTQFYCDFWGQTYTGNFENAYYYMPLLLSYNDDWFYYLRDPDAGTAFGPIRNVGGSPELATAADAEQAAESWFDGTYADLYSDNLPLCIVIVRNNGVTGMDGQVQPIDPINRGRSYFWRDVRPRNICPWIESY
jgi:hypothetical protein